MKKASLVVGITCGVLCAVCVVLYTSLVQEEADAARAEAMRRYGGEQVEVLVATQDIYPGDPINASNASLQMWLSDLLPEGCLTSMEEAQGKKAASLVMKGEAISQRRFEASGAKLEVPAGCVALSVPAKDVQAVGGALGAGSVVDVYATGSKTTRIGSSILVLATNAGTDELTNASVSWVTLAVPLDQSQEFVTASQSMDIYFVLPAPETDAVEAGDVDAGDAEDVAVEGAEDQRADADEAVDDAGT